MTLSILDCDDNLHASTTRSISPLDAAFDYADKHLHRRSVNVDGSFGLYIPPLSGGT